MNSLIVTYQGIFGGTRIATAGLAMPTASLALPAHQAWMSQGPAWGSAILGPAGRSRIVIGGTSSGRGGSHGKFGHAQSVNVPACHALCSNLSLPQHRGCTSGASRPFLFLTDTRKHQSMFCRDPLYVVSPRNSLIRLIRWRQPTELTIIDLAKPFHEDGHQ
jgi:hypothetical protein